MLDTQNRIKLSKLLAEGYELDATIASYDYRKGGKGEHIVYILADTQLMRYQACENMDDDMLQKRLADISDYYDFVVEARLDDKEYTPDTNMSETLAKTWEFGVIGACFLPDLIQTFWDLTNFRRTAS